MRRYKFDKKFTRYLVDKYDQNIKKAAGEIGCHPETIRRACRKHGIVLARGRKGHKSEVRVPFSKFRTWLEEYDGKVPKSYADIAEVSGFSYKTVYMYYYNRRKEAKDVLLQRPWAGENKSIIFETEDGTRVPTGSIAKIRAYVERTKGDIKLIVRTHSGQEFTFWYDPRSLKKLFL